MKQKFEDPTLLILFVQKSNIIASSPGGDDPDEGEIYNFGS